MSRRILFSSFKKQQGVTLVELIIAATLTLVLMAGISGIFIATQATYRTSEGLSRVQENVRTAFYLLDQDLRMAGGEACAPDGGDWKKVWKDNWGVKGVMHGNGLVTSGTATTDPALSVSGLIPGGVAGAAVSADEMEIFGQGMAASFKNENIVLVCNPLLKTAMLTKWENVQAMDGKILVNDDGSLKSFDRNSDASRIFRANWYIGCNGRHSCDEPAGKSLYRRYVDDEAETTLELVEGIGSIEIVYLRELSNDFVAADQISNAQWPTVVAARITINFVEPNTETSGLTNEGEPIAINRTVSKIITFRSRA